MDIKFELMLIICTAIYIVIIWQDLMAFQLDNNL